MTTQNVREMSSKSNIQSEQSAGGKKQYVEKKAKSTLPYPGPTILSLALLAVGRFWSSEDDDGDDDGDDDHPLVQGQDGLVSCLDPANLHKVPRLLKTLKEKLSASP